jgi:carbamoyltransferase
MYILGLNAYHGDSSAAIIKGGKLISAVEEERFRRIKHWAGFPRESIRYCLSEAGISLGDLDYIAVNKNSKVNIYKKVWFVLTKRPSIRLVKNRISHFKNSKNIKFTICEEFSFPENKIKAKVINVEHHRAHLGSSFFLSSFRDAALVSVDGFGDFTSSMVGKGRDNKIYPLYEINYPHSLGIFYSAFTQFLGFPKYGDEYKVMGLSAFGKPKYLEKMKDVLILRSQGRFKLNLKYFRHFNQGDKMQWNNTIPEFGRLFSDKLIDEFGKPREKGSPITGYYKDIAASVQAAYEEVFFYILNYAYKIVKLDKLCLAGGCAMNSLANGKIFDNTPFKNIFIQPAAGDAGGAIGAAYFLYHRILDKPRYYQMKTVALGPQYDDEHIRQVLELYKGKVDGCLLKEMEDKSELVSLIAKYLSEGNIVGWFQGRMEWGSRALGNRSILADPRRKDMRNIINKKIKMRESFRPFAPSILEEYVGDYFEIDYPDPFMLKVYPIRKEKQDIIPAVTHIDGTGRLQTVNKENNRLYWKLINEFRKLTGVPLLLNTSFNENEPIVNKPEEALDCFLRTDMDILVLERFVLIRR